MIHSIQQSKTLLNNYEHQYQTQSIFTAYTMQTTLAKPLDSEKQADTPLGKHASPHQPYQILYWAHYVNIVLSLLCDDVPHK